MRRRRRSGVAASIARDPVVSIAIMHHPARAEGMGALIRSCLPLVPQVVVDPDPAGVPSPLRTAKRAWAAVPSGSTHHLVLQDDVELMTGFAGQLEQLVRRRPDDALALCVNWDSPENSYLVRRAAAIGSSWAPLSIKEWTPTLGLVLPAEAARELAGYLAGFDDDYRDDDELITLFCRDRSLLVVAAVPHLIDHGSGPSLAGNDSHGARHATVRAHEQVMRDDHWSAGPGLVAPLAARSRRSGNHEFVVRLSESRCEIRFLRALAEEPVEHFYGWAWQDWAGITGVEPEWVLRSWEDFYRGARPEAAAVRRWVPARIPLDLAVEVWAAGFLLGADVAVVRADVAARAGGPPSKLGPVRPKVARLLPAAMASWIRSGLTRHDLLACGPTGQAVLADLATVAATVHEPAGQLGDHAVAEHV